MFQIQLNRFVLLAFRLMSSWLLVGCLAGPGWSAQPPGQLSPVQDHPERLLGPPPGEGPVLVRVEFELLDINSIDDEAETFEFNGVMTLSWQDKRQAFDPVQADTPEKVYQGNYQFNELAPAWFPQIVLANVSGQYDNFAVLLRIRPDGSCVLVQTVNAVAKADLNLRRYPFDAQRLEAVFEVLGFDSNEVVLQAANRQSGKEVIQIPQWSVTGVELASRQHVASYAGSTGISSAIVLTLDLQRQSFFMVRLVVLPLALIVVLSWSVFWINQSSLGDRLSVSFIGILTVVAYQIVVGDIMPQISYMTLMNGFLNFSFLVMCASVVVNVYVGILEKQGRIQQGNVVDVRCRWLFPMVYFGLLVLATIIAFWVFD